MPSDKVIIQIDGDTEMVEDVADVAEVTEGRLRIATLDGESDMIGGEIFGAFGEWKMWHERNGDVSQYVTDTPLTMPGDFIRFHHQYEGRWLRRDRAGRIKRLKRLDL